MGEVDPCGGSGAGCHVSIAQSAAGSGCPAGPFTGTASYWDSRYRSGGNSGAGFHGRLAEFKADILNQFVESKSIQTVVEFGCGDGTQLSLALSLVCGTGCFPGSSCDVRAKFGEDPKEFRLLAEQSRFEGFDLALSLDVVYHLIEHDVFEKYLRELFRASARYVIVYSSNAELHQARRMYGIEGSRHG